MENLLSMTYRPGGETIRKDGRTSQYVASGFTDTQTVHLDVGTASDLIAYMLIDLSDNSTWKHTNTGHINLEYIILEVDPDDSWKGEVKLGFLENVGAANGDFYTIIDIDMGRKSGLLVENLNFGTHGLDCESSHHFGPITVDSILFRTSGANLGGPDAPGTPTYPSGEGDLAMIIDGDNTNTVDVSITIGYETSS